MIHVHAEVVKNINSAAVENSDKIKWASEIKRRP